MKRFYQTLETSYLLLECENGILNSSVEPVEETSLNVEVDDYITIDDHNISFD